MEDIIIQKTRGVLTLTFNRPKKKNAITSEMFEKFEETINSAANDDDVCMVVVSGTGDYFTSGNDLTNFMNASSGTEVEMDFELMAKKGRDGFHKLVKTLIDFPKILAAVVNGSAVGIGVTMLGLFDLVYASDQADFYTPFAIIAQCPEACSSYIFPRLMGFGKASELLVFGKKMTAEEAYISGLVNEVFPHHNLSIALDRIFSFAENIDSYSMTLCKKVMRHHIKDKLHEVNDMECDTLLKCWTSDRFFTAMIKFYTKRSKL